MSGTFPNHASDSLDGAGPRHETSGHQEVGPRLRTRFPRRLLAYFRSGWAFFIPYLICYLLYAWLQWPVNPPKPGSTASGAATGVPPLLEVFWLLHGLHLLLGASAVGVWWRDSIRHRLPDHATRPRLQPGRGDGGNLGPAGAALADAALHLAPWLCLALLFWLPGVYLEYPADPWEHLRRINDWSTQDFVRQNFAWAKSSYFFTYSLVGHIESPLLQLKWWDSFYAASCLLLSWQHYRLARAVGLGGRASFMFVLLNVLTFGNNIFGFYRYYGMSSSVFAQLGAVALVRIVLAALAKGTSRLDGERSQKPVRRQVLALLAPSALLLLFIAFNHVQGLGIAGLGIAAVVVWRLIEWRRSLAGWLILGAVALSVATVLWYPRFLSSDNLRSQQGWLTAWSGFNMFSPASPAFARAVVIIGLSGLLNLIASLVLLRRNHVAAWLTLVPLLALSLPFIAIPYLLQLAHSDQPALVYHRMLLAIPCGLALVAVVDGYWSRRGAALNQGVHPGFRASSPFLLLLLALLTLTLTPPGYPSYNRLYHALMQPAADLTMGHVFEAMDRLDLNPRGGRQRPPLVATAGISFVTYSAGFRPVVYPDRVINSSSYDRLIQAESYIIYDRENRIPFLFLPPHATELNSPGSIVGYLSGHWLPQEAALEQAGGPEFEQMTRGPGFQKIEAHRFWYLLFTPK